MPSNVALLLCTAFVAYLLHFDRKHSKKLSGALWIPTLWLLYCGSRPVGAWFGGQGVEEGSGKDRWFQLILMLAAAFVISKRGYNWRQALSENAWLVALLLFSAVSIAWSDESFISLKRWVRMSGSIIVAMVIASEPAWERGLEAVLRRSVYILIPYSLLLIKYFPSLGVEYNAFSGQRMWAGVTTQKNGLGRLCMISAFYLVWSFFKRRWLRERTFPANQRYAEYFIFAITLFLLKGPRGDYSATSTAVLILGVSILWLLFRMHQRERIHTGPISALFAIALALGIAIPVVGTAGTSAITEVLGRDATFTGRTQIWGDLLRVSARNPILGVGYGAFWIHPPLSYSINESHNGYLEIYLELGLVGLLLLIATLFSFWFKTSSALRHQFAWSSFTLCLLVMAVVHNTTESSFLRSTSHIWTLLVFLLVCLPRSARKRNRPRARAPTAAKGAVNPRVGSVSA